MLFTIRRRSQVSLRQAIHKAGVGAIRSLVQRRTIRMRVIMTAVNCSPAVASRQAKYADEFQVQMLLGAQPRPRNYFCSRRATFFRWLFEIILSRSRRKALKNFISAQQRNLLIPHPVV